MKKLIPVLVSLLVVSCNSGYAPASSPIDTINVEEQIDTFDGEIIKDSIVYKNGKIIYRKIVIDTDK